MSISPKNQNISRKNESLGKRKNEIAKINSQITKDLNPLTKTEFKFPKVDTEVNIGSNSTIGSLCENQVINPINLIFNIIYNKLIEKDSNNILDCLIKSFDCLSIQSDIKFKKISEIIKAATEFSSISKIDKKNLENLKIENDQLKTEINKKEKIISDLNDKIIQLESYLNDLFIYDPMNDF